MDDKNYFFSIPRHLNKGKSLAGLPRDEAIPALLIFVLFFAAKHYLIGLILASIWFMGLRYIKVQYGEHIIALSLYWWGSASLNKNIFKHTPASEQRYWLS